MGVLSVTLAFCLLLSGCGKVEVYKTKHEIVLQNYCLNLNQVLKRYQGKYRISVSIPAPIMNWQVLK